MPGEAPILASGSRTRRILLEAAGIEVAVCPAEVDETELKKGMTGRPAGEIALRLAVAKAQDVSRRNNGRLVIGADQTLSVGTDLFDKPPTRDAAREQLISLRNKTHRLHAAVVVVVDGAVVWECCETADLTMRDFSDAFLDSYLARVGDGVLTSVGAYQLEGLGLQLFAAVAGDHTTILGLPMLPLLSELRRRGLLPT